MNEPTEVVATNAPSSNPASSDPSHGKLALHWKILIALALGAVAGHFSAGASVGNVSLLAGYEFLGGLFMNALKMIIVPLIMSSIALGVAALGNSKSLGTMGLKTMMFYLMTITTAIIVGLVIVNFTQPGIVDGKPAGEILALTTNGAEVQAKVAGRDLSEIPQILLKAVPQNIVAAAAGNEMLALIFFSALVGFFMSKIEHELARVLYRFTSAVFETMILITNWVMKFAPYGVFGLVAAVVTKTGFAAAQPLVVFSLSVVAALLFHSLVTLPALVR
ncbi:MAG: dicarboxylate/amino acid:cation symporter, partial [Lysobacterales bacterium]